MSWSHGYTSPLVGPAFLKYDPFHPLNRELVFWHHYFPGNGAVPALSDLGLAHPRDITGLNKLIWLGEYPDWRSGAEGQAYPGGLGLIHFVADDRLRVPHGPHLSGFNQLTIACVFFEQDWAGNETRPIVSKCSQPQGASTDIEYYIEVRNQSGVVTVRCAVSPDGTTTNQAVLDYQWDTLVTRKPNFLVFTWDGTTGYLYIADGPYGDLTLRASGPMSIGGPTYSGTSNLTWGSWDNGSDFHTGPMDNMRILRRFWTAEEARWWHRETRLYSQNLLNLEPLPYLPPRVAGATVDILDSDGTTVLATTTTDAYGRFSVPANISGLPKIVGVRVSGNNITPETRSVPLSATDTNVNLSLGAEVSLPVSCTVSGTVRLESNNSPISGATVRLLDEDSSTLLESTTTNAQGQYTLTHEFLESALPRTVFVEASGNDFFTSIDPVSFSTSTTSVSRDIAVHDTATLSDGAITGVTSSSITAQVVTLLGSGTLAAVAVPAGSSVPTPAQIVAGQDASGNPAPAASKQLLAAGPNNITVSGLNIATNYDIHIVQKTTTYSNVVSLTGRTVETGLFFSTTSYGRAVAVHPGASGGSYNVEVKVTAADGRVFTRTVPLVVSDVVVQPPSNLAISLVEVEQDNLPPRDPGGLSAQPEVGRIRISGIHSASPDLAQTRLYRSEDDTTWALLHTFVSATPGQSFVVVDDGSLSLPAPQVGTTYYYRAEFEDGAGNVTVSSSVSASPLEGVAPSLQSAVIGASGTTLTLTFDENVQIGVAGAGGVSLSASGGPVTPTFSSVSGADVVFTLSRTIGSHETVTVSYTQPGDGIEDLVGNDAGSFSNVTVTNNSTQDLIPPTLQTATIAADGVTLTLVFSEAVNVSTGSGFSVADSSGSMTPTYQSGSGTSNIVFSLPRVVQQSDSVTLAYSGSTVADVAGNALATISDFAVTNNSTQNTDTTPPSLLQASTSPDGSLLRLSFSEIVVFGTSGADNITLSASGGAVTATYSDGSGTSLVTYALSRAVGAGETVTVSYTQPGDGWQDLAGNLLASFSGVPVSVSSFSMPDPLMPLNLTVSEGDAHNTVLWKNPSASGMTAVEVHGSTTAGFTPGPATLLHTVSSPVPGDKRSFKHAGLTNGTTWYYTILAKTSTDSRACPERMGTPQATIYPADLHTLQGAWSLRKMRSTYSGFCIRVRRDGDAAETDIGFSGPDLDVSALEAFASGSRARVVTIYSQISGVPDLVASDNTKAPLITDEQGRVLRSRVNGKPHIVGDGTWLEATGVSFALGAMAAVFEWRRPSGAYLVSGILSYETPNKRVDTNDYAVLGTLGGGHLATTARYGEKGVASFPVDGEHSFLLRLQYDPAWWGVRFDPSGAEHRGYIGPYVIGYSSPGNTPLLGTTLYAGNDLVEGYVFQEIVVLPEVTETQYRQFIFDADRYWRVAPTEDQYNNRSGLPCGLWWQGHIIDYLRSISVSDVTFETTVSAVSAGTITVTDSRGPADWSFLPVGHKVYVGDKTFTLSAVPTTSGSDVVLSVNEDTSGVKVGDPALYHPIWDGSYPDLETLWTWQIVWDDPGDGSRTPTPQGLREPGWYTLGTQTTSPITLVQSVTVDEANPAVGSPGTIEIKEATGARKFAFVEVDIGSITSADEIVDPDMYFDVISNGTEDTQKPYIGFKVYYGITWDANTATWNNPPVDLTTNPPYDDLEGLDDYELTAPMFLRDQLREAYGAGYTKVTIGIYNVNQQYNGTSTQRTVSLGTFHGTLYRTQGILATSQIRNPDYTTGAYNYGGGMSIAWWANQSLPAYGGEGNPLYQSSAVLNRAMVIVALDNLLGPAKGGSVYTWNQYVGGYILSSAKTIQEYEKQKELPPSLRRSLEMGISSWVKTVRYGGTYAQLANLELKTVEGVACFSRIVRHDDYLYRLCVEQSRNVPYGKPDGEPGVDIRYYNPEGNFYEGKLPEGSYHNRSKGHIINARIYTYGDANFDHIDTMLKQVAMWDEHTLAVEDGNKMEDTSGYSARTSDAVLGGQWDHDHKITYGLLYDEAKWWLSPSVGGNSGWSGTTTAKDASSLSSDLSSSLNQLGALVESRDLPPVYVTKSSWQPHTPLTFPVPGWSSTLNTILSGDGPELYPVNHPKAGTPDYVYQPPANEPRWTFIKKKTGTPEEWGCCIEHLHKTGYYNGYESSGGLMHFWTKRAGAVIRTDRASREYSRVHEWALEHIWGYRGTNAFSFAYLKDLTDTTVSASPTQVTATVDGALILTQDKNDLLNPGDTWLRQKTFRWLDASTDGMDGLEVTATLTYTPAGTPVQIENLYWTVPIFNPGTVNVYASVGGSAWSQIAPGISMQADYLKIERDSGDGSPDPFWIKLGSVRDVSVSAQGEGVWSHTYKILSIDLHPNPGVATDIPASITETITLTTTDPGISGIQSSVGILAPVAGEIVPVGEPIVLLADVVWTGTEGTYSLETTTDGTTWTPHPITINHPNGGNQRVIASQDSWPSGVQAVRLKIDDGTIATSEVAVSPNTTSEVIWHDYFNEPTTVTLDLHTPDVNTIGASYEVYAMVQVEGGTGQVISNNSWGSFWFDLPSSRQSEYRIARVKTYVTASSTFSSFTDSRTDQQTYYNHKKAQQSSSKLRVQSGTTSYPETTGTYVISKPATYWIDAYALQSSRYFCLWDETKTTLLEVVGILGAPPGTFRSMGVDVYNGHSNPQEFQCILFS